MIFSKEPLSRSINHLSRRPCNQAYASRPATKTLLVWRLGPARDAPARRNLAFCTMARVLRLNELAWPHALKTGRFSQNAVSSAPQKRIKEGLCFVCFGEHKEGLPSFGKTCGLLARGKGHSIAACAFVFFGGQASGCGSRRTDCCILELAVGLKLGLKQNQPVSLLGQALFRIGHQWEIRSVSQQKTAISLFLAGRA